VRNIAMFKQETPAPVTTNHAWRLQSRCIVGRPEQLRSDGVVRNRTIVNRIQQSPSWGSNSVSPTRRKNSQHLMENEGSLPCSQQPLIWFYHQSD